MTQPDEAGAGSPELAPPAEAAPEAPAPAAEGAWDGWKADASDADTRSEKCLLAGGGGGRSSSSLVLEEGPWPWAPDDEEDDGPIWNGMPLLRGAGAEPEGPEDPGLLRVNDAPPLRGAEAPAAPLMLIGAFVFGFWSDRAWRSYGLPEDMVLEFEGVFELEEVNESS